MTDTNGSAESLRPEESPQPPRKPRRWLRRIVLLGTVLIVLLGVLVGLAPTLVSTDSGRQFALQQAAPLLPGEIQAGNWSLSWFGPQRVEALQFQDPQQREVLQTKSIEVERGLLALLTGGFDFGTIVIEEPEVRLHLEDGAGGNDSTPSAPSDDSGNGSLPEIRGRLEVRDGSITFSRAGMGEYQLSNLNADVALQTLNAISADLQTQLPDGNTLEAKVDLQELAASGSIDAAQARGTASVRSSAATEVGQLVSILTGQSDLQGKALVDINLAAEPQQLKTEALVALQNLVAPGSGGRPVNLELRGTGGLQNEQVTADVQLTGSRPFLSVQASGTTTAVDSTLSADLGALHQELAQVFDLGGLKFSGQASGNANLRQDGDGYATELDLTIQQLGLLQESQSISAGEVRLTHSGPLAGGDLKSDGNLVVSNLRAGGKSIDQQATVEWTGLEVGQMVKAQQLHVQATPLQVAAEGLGLDPAQGTLSDGKLQLQANLAQVMELVAGISGNPAPQISGQANFDLQVAGAGGKQQLRGNGTIRDLQVGDGLREPQVQLTLDATLDPQAGTLTLGNNAIDSEKIKLAVAGELRDYSGDAKANLQGTYDLSWEAITALLHELSPSTREVVAIRGNSRSDWSVRGPLGALPGLEADLQLGWDGIDLLGIPISEARFAPSLRNAKLTVPPASMQAAQGKVTLGGTLDLAPEAPLLELPGETRLLDGIALTPQLAQDLLSRINPIFYGMLETSGQVNLTVNDLRLPLGAEVADQGRGNGQLELVDMKVRPGGLVLTLAELAGLQQANELLAIQLQGGAFELSDGRIRYDDFTLIFPEDFDLKFFGSVGFDDTLDLVLSIPIRADLLQRLGVGGDVVRYAEMLDGTRVDVPLTGTRQQPKLQLDKIDTGKLLKDVLQGEVENKGKALLDGVLGGGSGDKSDDKAADDGKKEKPLRGLLDGLKRGNKKDKDKP